MRERITNRLTPRLVLPVLIVGFAALATFAAFYAGVSLSRGEGVEAQTAPEIDDAEFLSATPEPGEVPDFTKDFWYQKWTNQENEQPRYDQVINGILVGPTVRRSGSICSSDNPPQDIPFEDTRGSRVAIEFGYVPDGFELAPTMSSAVFCGEPTGAEVFGSVPSGDHVELIQRLAAGESFFDIPHGSSINVYRTIGDPAFTTSIPAERWIAVEIAGVPAAVGRPLFDEGFGKAQVIMHRDGVLTVVRSDNLSLEQLLLVAEGLMQ